MSHEFLDQFLSRRFGFDPSTLGPKAVEEALRSRMAVRKILTIEDYVYILTHDATEPQALVEKLVIPETWFFRYPISFEHMTSFLVNTWFRRYPGGRPRILTVPCSTGEEPYTVAMSLLAAGIPASKIQIDAIDISRNSLETARHGIFGRNSFRGTDLSYRNRYFVPLGEDYVVRPEVRDCVKFAYDNLLAPGFTDRHGVYDIVFCRNLLIYFDEVSRRQAAAVLQKSMSKFAILYLGHAENMAMVEHGFMLLEGPHAFACVRPDAELAPGMAVKTSHQAKSATSMGTAMARSVIKLPPIVPAKPPSRSGSSGIFGVPAYGVPAQNAPSRSHAGSTSLAGATTRSPADLKSKPGQQTPPPDSAVPKPKLSPLEEVRQMADQGLLKQALVSCEKILREAGPSADVLCMLGILHQADGQNADAEKAFNKALYLDHQHYDALLHLSLLYEKIGEDRMAENLMRRAQRVGKQGKPG